MRNPAQFVRSIDRPLPSSMLWLGAVVLCVDGQMDWATIDFHGVASEDPKRVAFILSAVHARKHTAPLMPDFSLHLDFTPLPNNFTGFTVLGFWCLDELRAVRLRAAKAEFTALTPGLINSAIAAVRGVTSSWLAMSEEAGGVVDRLIQARDTEHAARIALALPGTLRGLLPLADLASHIQSLEAGANADPYSGALPFRHRSVIEAEIEHQEFIANNPACELSKKVLHALEHGLPLPPLGQTQVPSRSG